MGFFYDNCDLYNMGVFGSGTTEISCLSWEELEITAIQTRDAFLKSLNLAIIAASPCVYGEECESVFDEKIYTDFWRGCYLNFLKKFLVFWNMMRCEENKMTGVQTESVGLPIIEGGYDEVEFEVDYGDGSFDITIAEEYQTTEAEFMCCVQNVMVLIMDEQFEQSTMPEFIPIG